MKKADLTSLIHTTKTLIIIAKKAMKDGKVELAQDYLQATIDLINEETQEEN